MKRPWPKASSTLSPKIHRNHMLPMMCDQPPCRNIEVMRVIGRTAAGTTPYSIRNRWRSSGLIESSRTQASALRTMKVTVTKGTVRDGITSRNGIMGQFYGSP
jgi:hypothetical protein